MSGINGTCSDSYGPSQSQLLFERGLQQHQAQRLEATRAESTTTPGSGDGALQLATAINAPSRVPEANKGENIDIYV